MRRAVLLSLAGRHGLEARATVSTRAHTHLPVTKRIRHHPVDVLAVSAIASAFVTVKHPLQLQVWLKLRRQAREFNDTWYSMTRYMYAASRPA